MKRFFITISRIILIYIMTDILLEPIIDANSKLTLTQWINRVFKSVYYLNQNGEKIFEFMKFLTSVSLFLLLEFDSIIFVSDLSEGFNEIVKFHSKNKRDYIINLIKISKGWIFRDLIYWILMFIISVFILKRVNITNNFDYLSLISFLTINLLLNTLIMIIAKNSLFTISSYILKHLIYSVFLGYEIFLVTLIAVIIIVYIKSNNKIGEFYENYRKKR